MLTSISAILILIVYHEPRDRRHYISLSDILSHSQDLLPAIAETSKGSFVMMREGIVAHFGGASFSTAAFVERIRGSRSRMGTEGCRRSSLVLAERKSDSLSGAFPHLEKK